MSEAPLPPAAPVTGPAGGREPVTPAEAPASVTAPAREPAIPLDPEAEQAAALDALRGPVPAEFQPYQQALRDSTEALDHLGYTPGMVVEMIANAKARGIDAGAFGGIVQDLIRVAKTHAPTEEEQRHVFESHEAQHRARAEGELRGEYGEEFSERIREARQFAERVFGGRLDDLAELELRDGTRLGNHPGFIRALVSGSQRVAALESMNAGGRTMDLSISPEVARAQIKRFEYENQEALFSTHHPLHAEAVEQRNALYVLAHGTKPSGTEAAAWTRPADVVPLPDRTLRTDAEGKLAAISQKSIDQFEREQRAALFSESHPDHAWAIEQRRRLYRALYG